MLFSELVPPRRFKFTGHNALVVARRSSINCWVERHSRRRRYGRNETFCLPTKVFYTPLEKAHAIFTNTSTKEWSEYEKNDLDRVRDMPFFGDPTAHHHCEEDYDIERETLRRQMGNRKEQDDYEAMAEESREQERDQQG